ncbi:MAG TPA: UMP kinase, partial [Xanthobacteraceae bacterium]|nr:UMP kinase [Xanthobacteraceae bacterium]
MANPKFRRVIVKLSGEALSGPEKFGIHQPTIDRFAA